MQLSPDKLKTNLCRPELAPVYFISGDEPLQKIECIDQVRVAARARGYDERVVFHVDKNFDWGSINRTSNNLSLFASRRIIELRLTSPKKIGKEAEDVLFEYTTRSPSENLLIISSDKMDKSVITKKWVKAIEKVGILIMVWPVDPGRLPGWIQTRMMQTEKKRISPDAARFIAQCVEGNLMAARQEIDKLALLFDKESIDVDDVVGAVTDSARYNVFNMVESAFTGDAVRALLMLSGLRDEGTEPLALFAALRWEFRQVCSMGSRIGSGTTQESVFKHYRVRERKKRTLAVVLKRHSERSLQKLLDYCALIDKSLKQGKKDQAWDQLRILLLAIAGFNTERLQII